VYDRKASQIEMEEKVLIDPSLQGKTREEMGLEPFRCTEIRSSIMGIPVFISEGTISWVIRRAFEGKFVSGLDNSRQVHGMTLSTKLCSTALGRVSTMS